MATFGETGTGSNDWTFNYEGLTGSIFTAPADGTITKVFVRIKGNPSSLQVKAHVYDVSGGAPDTKLASSTAQTPVDSEHWEEIAVSQAISNGVDYCIAISHEGSDLKGRAQSNVGDNINRDPQTFCSEGAWSDSAYADFHLCIYAEYTPAGAGISIPVAMHHYGHHITKIIRG